MHIVDASLLSLLYKLLNVIIFKLIWLPSLAYACFFIVFGWHPWSSCILKVKKFLVMDQFTHSHFCPSTTLCESLSRTNLYSVSFKSWVTCSIAELAGVIGTLTDDTAWATAEASSNLVLWCQALVVWMGTAERTGASWPREDTVSPLVLEFMEEGSKLTGLQLAEVCTLPLEVFVPFMLKI